MYIYLDILYLLIDLYINYILLYYSLLFLNMGHNKINLYIKDIYNYSYIY